jgi:hypothetical protein
MGRRPGAEEAAGEFDVLLDRVLHCCGCHDLHDLEHTSEGDI